jgi:hypothetical protein
MALYRFVPRFQGETLLPEDVFENVLYYDVSTSSGILETVADGIIAAFEAWGFHGGIASAEVRAYAMPASGPPDYQKDYPLYVHSATQGPSEVALCLSYATTDAWEGTTARRRGRIFLGPLQSSDMGIPRPTTPLVPATLTLGQALYSVGGTEAMWMLWSPTDAIAAPIEVVSVDNAWDTQRRRGLSPTSRSVLNVA